MTDIEHDPRITRRETRAHRAAFVLTGLLGVTWVVVIASRYASLVPV